MLQVRCVITPGNVAPSVTYVEVLTALRNLDRIDHDALRLIYRHGRIQAQVADELHVPLNTVGAAVARGMRRIADYLTNP